MNLSDLNLSPELIARNPELAGLAQNQKPASKDGKLRIKTTILVEPTAKGRPRLTTVNGQARAFTPAKTRNAETAIQYAIRQQLSGVEMLPRPLAVALTVTFYRPRPTGLRKSITLPVTRPDLDNYVKCCLDSINCFLLADDAQVTTIVARKRYAAAGECPRIELELTNDEEV